MRDRSPQHQVTSKATQPAKNPKTPKLTATSPVRRVLPNSCALLSSSGSNVSARQ